MNPILTIDPGASGGLALLNSERIVEAFPMRDGMTGQIDAIRHIAATNPEAQLAELEEQAAEAIGK